MALYVPHSRRRRRTVSLAATVGILGLVVGGVLGRLTAPTVAERVATVRADARDTASGLRVISLHGEAGVEAVGAGGADLVLERTRTELAAEFAEAPWLSGAQKGLLLTRLSALKAMPNHDGAEFGESAADLAKVIEDVFNGKLDPGGSAASKPAPSASPSPSSTPTPSPTPATERTASPSPTP